MAGYGASLNGEVIMKILCSVWKQPGGDKLCETHEVIVTEEEILKLATEKAKSEKGWTDADIYNVETEHIKM